MGDAKIIWGLYNTLYALIFYASPLEGKSMGDWVTRLGDASPHTGFSRILLGCGVTRHALTILAVFFFGHFLQKYVFHKFFRFLKKNCMNIDKPGSTIP